MGALFPILKIHQFWPTATKLDKDMFDAKTKEFTSNGENMDNFTALHTS